MSVDPPDCIAIDGPAASGKTTVGLAIAKTYGYLFLDTGLMYRAVTLAAIRTGTPATATALKPLIANLRMRVAADVDGTRIFLDDEDVTELLRGKEVEARVSDYSAIPLVREAMVAEQRRVASHGKAVLAGRDIGTVVLPDAPLKLYFDASEAARARRRGVQETRDSKQAQDEIAKRDGKDSTRKTSPLRPAEDAIVIDTTEMTLDQVVAEAMERVACANA